MLFKNNIKTSDFAMEQCHFLVVSTEGVPPLPALTQSLEELYSVCGVMDSSHGHSWRGCDNWELTSYVSEKGVGHGQPRDLERQERGFNIGWGIWNSPFLIIFFPLKRQFHMVQLNFLNARVLKLRGSGSLRMGPEELFIQVFPGMVHQLVLWLPNPRTDGDSQ